MPLYDNHCSPPLAVSAMANEHQITVDSSPEPNGEQLCLSCLSANDRSAHFCRKCGAQLTSLAATAPFVSIFAEGHALRQAVERPHKLIVVLGIWIIFGMIMLASMVLILMGKRLGLQYVLVGVFFLPVSVIIIWRATRSYLKKVRKCKRASLDIGTASNTQ